jgi:hypothetical protein
MLRGYYGAESNTDHVDFIIIYFLYIFNTYLGRYVMSVSPNFFQYENYLRRS